MIERVGLSVRRSEPEARLVLHCAPGDRGAFAGLNLPEAMLRSAASGGWHALHLAPDEWLLAGPADEAEAAFARIGEAAVPHALVDVSDRTLGLIIEGEHARALLASACPLDLRDAAFPAGACSRTLFGKASVLLWRTGEACWRLDYGRSFDGYVTALIARAAEDSIETA